MTCGLYFLRHAAKSICHQESLEGEREQVFCYSSAQQLVWIFFSRHVYSSIATKTERGKGGSGEEEALEINKSYIS